MKKVWQITHNEKLYEINVHFNGLIGKLNMTLNGQKIDYVPSLLNQIKGFDVPFEIDYEKAYVQIVGRKADLAYEGYFLESHKEYKPIGKMPIWNWVFILLSVMLPILSGGELIPFIISLVSIMYCMRTASSPKIIPSWKLIFCFLIVVSAWFLFGILIMLTSPLV